MKRLADQLNSDEALHLMIEGNARFASGVRAVESFVSSLRLRDLAEKGQKPFCVILTCSDSRAPTETIFDRGLGDMFVLRVAGNVLSPVFLAGIEYASRHFDIPLCIVMGHTQCGAIAATLGRAMSPDNPLPSSHLETLTQTILPFDLHLIELPDPSELTEKRKEKALKDLNWANVRRNVARIGAESPMLAERIEKGDLRIVGCLYYIESGKVTFDLKPQELGRLSSLKSTSELAKAMAYAAGK